MSTLSYRVSRMEATRTKQSLTDAWPTGPEFYSVQLCRDPQERERRRVALGQKMVNAENWFGALVRRSSSPLE